MTQPEGRIPEGTQAEGGKQKLRIVIPMTIAVAFLMEQLDSTIIATAIPDMAASLGTTPLRLNLAITTYVLTLAVFIPVSGWFADRFGARRIFMLALVVFTLGSVLCGMADSIEMLLVTRAVQGLGGAMMTPVGRLILLRSFPRNQIARAMIYMTIPVIIGPVLGPPLGGFLTTYASWRWIFYVNVPFGLIGILLVLRFIEDTGERTRTRFDFPGFLMLGTGAALLQFGLENVGHRMISVSWLVLSLGLAVLLLAIFMVYARKVKTPVVDLGLFRNRCFRIGTLPPLMCRIPLSGVPFLVPLLLQVGFGMSAVAAGSLMLAAAFGAPLMRPTLTPLLRILGFRWLMALSAVMAAVVVASFALLTAESPHWLIAFTLFVYSMGRSMHFMTSNLLAYADTPPEKLSNATSIGSVVQQLGVSFGVSTAAMLLGIVTPENQLLEPRHFSIAFLLLGVIPLFSVPWFLRLGPDDGLQVSGGRPRSARRSRLRRMRVRLRHHRHPPGPGDGSGG